MNKCWRFALIIVGVSFLIGCGSFKGQNHVNELNAKKLGDNSFNMYLAKEYRELANFEWNKMRDYRDGNLYAEKGLDASNGHLALPSNPKNWHLPHNKEKEIYAAHHKLLRYLTADAGGRIPKEASIAQTRFDCWVEQQHENWQSKDIAECQF